MSNVTGNSIGLPVYAELANRLRSSISKGEYQPGDCIGSEYELARKQSISRMTVRRASELLVNEGLLERRPGKGLYVRPKHVSTRMVQIIAANLEWEPCLQISRGAQMASKSMGIQVQMYDAHGDQDLDVEVVRQLPATQARGAIIVSLHSAAFNEAVFSLKMQHFPFVLVDQRLHDINVPSVMADNYDGGQQAGRALLERGHQRIAFIGDLVADTVRDRLAGLRDVVNDAGIAFDRSLVVDLVTEMDRLGDWSDRVDAAVGELMSQPKPPTAIACSCDGVARSAYRALSNRGLSVPEDMSVIGFDDDPLADWLTPGLSSIRQPFREMGRRAADLLTQQMSPTPGEVEHVVLPVELVERGSIAAPRQVTV